VQGFDLIAPDSAIKDLRGDLLNRVDQLIEQEKIEVSGKQAKDARDSGELNGLWQTVREKTEEYKAGTATLDDLHDAVNRFYSWQKKTDRNDILKDSNDPALLHLKHKLLEMLRKVDVYVLEKGAIEEYYPSTIAGADKPSKAQDFCAKINTRELVLGCCGEQTFERNGSSFTEKEFNLIFQSIFEPTVTN
jgi:putative ATP-dependent endonuclease of OLD family